VLTVKVLTPDDQKNIRSCRGDKQTFLKSEREKEKSYAALDQALLEAKLKESNPNDTAIQKLMEKKYNFEQKFENTYIKTSKGKVCLEQEKQRNKKISKALDQSPEYRSLKQKVQLPGI
jgi:hypothetical protein